MGATPSGEGADRFPLVLPPPKIAGLGGGGIWPAAAEAMRLAAHCTGAGRKSGRVGEEGGLRGPM